MPKSKSALSGVPAPPKKVERRKPAPLRSRKATPGNVMQSSPKGSGKMQTIYLRETDLDRVNDLEHAIRKAHVVPGRVGLSLVLRAGLRLLADEFQKNAKRGVDLVAAVATEGKD